MDVITLAELKIISDEKGFNIALIEKDYLITYLLYLLKDVENIYFKGGTALNKIFLNHERLSEDLDFTLTTDLDSVEKEIRTILKGTIFDKISHDKRVDKFVRLIVEYKLFHDTGTIFLDLNERGKLLLKPEKYEVKHFYKDHIPQFSVKTLSLKEMVAEKMAAAIGRNRPRDHFDLLSIISRKIPIDYALVKSKCAESGDEFSILKVFNKAKTLKNRWDEDINPVLAKKITFVEVMKTLAKHFKYTEEKEKLKQQNSDSSKL